MVGGHIQSTRCSARYSSCIQPGRQAGRRTQCTRNPFGLVPFPARQTKTTRPCNENMCLFPSSDRRLAAFIIPLYNICLAMNLIDVHSWPCGQSEQTGRGGSIARHWKWKAQKHGQRVGPSRERADSESVRNFNQFDFIERR